MKERPIIFSGPMVRAILDGKKTQTRRVVKPMRGEQSEWLTAEKINAVHSGRVAASDCGYGWQMYHPLAGTVHHGITEPDDSPYGWIRSPYGKPGDRLWVKETFCGRWVFKTDSWFPDDCGERIITKGKIKQRDGTYAEANEKQMIFAYYRATYGDTVPREDLKWKSSRYMPKWASRITLEVTDIRVEWLYDISTEDIIAEGLSTNLREHDAVLDLRAQYFRLWDDLNAKRGFGSDMNPWCWCITFKQL